MNFNRIRIIMLSAAAAFSSSVLFAQMDPMAPPASATQANPSGQQRPSTTAMQDSAANAGDVGQIMKDKMFLRGAAESGIAAEKFSQLALERAGSEDVKLFGQKVIDDHIQLDTAMAPVVDAMGIRLPKEMNKADQAAYEKLRALSGSDFETAYLTQMVMMHHKAMRNFRVEANSVTDPQLSEFVAKGEHTLHEHLVMVNKLAKEKGIPLPARAGKPASPPPA